MNINKRLTVHHVGGRAGSRAFPFLSKFEKDIIDVLYDADTDCLAQIQERRQRYESELHVLPYCLGDTCRLASFNINYDPYSSSLRELNPTYGSFYFFYGDHDHIISETFKTMEKRYVDIVSLDHLFQSKTLSVPPPDFLSIDTQGSEYEILQGAKETLRLSTLALVVEVEFHPIYKDQKLFGDVANLLSDQGFDFVKLLHVPLELSPFRASVGLRGEGFYTSADALFFRRIDNIEMENNDFIRYLMLQKLSFIAIIFNQFEYGLQCLRRGKGLAIRHPIMEEELEELAYCRFLRDLEGTIAQMPTSFPRTFASKYTFEASRARFESSTDFGRLERKESYKTGVMHRIKQVLRQVPALFLFLKALKKGLIGVTKRIKRASLTVTSRMIFRRYSSSKRYSDVEAVLISYGLESQAETLRKNRIIQSRFCE